jgi:hypothetical protein
MGAGVLWDGASRVSVVESEHPEEAAQGDGAGPEPFPTMVITPKFEQLLAPIEARLRSTLDAARIETSHAPTIGAKCEAAVRRELRGFLPPGFGVGHGFIYDGYGDGTRQTDFIITNPDNPVTYSDDEPGTYVVDGVSVAGEVKAFLTTGELNDCIKKAILHKQLRMSFNERDNFTVEAHRTYMMQTGYTPAFVVIAFETNIARQTLLQRLAAAPLVPVPAGKAMEDGKGNDLQSPIDAVCILVDGFMWNSRPAPADLLPARPQINGQPYYGWFALGTQAPLMLTLAWLHSVMAMRIRRGASVFVPYLVPYPKQAAYMANKATSFEPPPPADNEEQGSAT